MPHCDRKGTRECQNAFTNYNPTARSTCGASTASPPPRPFTTRRPPAFEISGIFRDPADFAVAVLYDADNFFEHPSIKYLPDFNFAGLTLISACSTPTASSPSIRPNTTGSTGPRSTAFAPTAAPPISPCWITRCWPTPLSRPRPPPSTSSPAALRLNDRLTLWYQNLAFDYIVPGGTGGSATYFCAGCAIHRQSFPSDRPPTLTMSPRRAGTTERPSRRAWPRRLPPIRRSRSASAGERRSAFTSKVNTGGTVNVSGYTLWLITESPDAFIAAEHRRPDQQLQLDGAPTRLTVCWPRSTAVPPSPSPPRAMAP